MSPPGSPGRRSSSGPRSTPTAARPCFLVGAEPDHLWRAFSTAVVDLAHQFGVSQVVGLGAYPAAVPHTRPIRVVATATSAEQAHRVGTVAGRIDVPAGIHAAIEIAAVGERAPLAQPLGPGAALRRRHALPGGLRGDRHRARRPTSASTFPAGTLADDARSTRARLDELVGNNDEHQAMVGQLERQYDTAEDIRGPLPTGDDLAAELEQFLRDQE